METRQSRDMGVKARLYMGAGKFENKHGVGILLNKKWRKKSWTEYIRERAIAAMITVNKQHIMLMSVYFPHTGYADHHVERAYKSIEKLVKSKKKHTNYWRRLQRGARTWC